MPDEPNNPKLLELAPAELVVSLKVSHAGRPYRVRHFLTPPAPADWAAYEAALQMAVEELPCEDDSGEPSYRLEMRSADAALLLWTRLARRVEGYALPDAADAWRDLIPLAHKEAAVRALLLVAPAPPFADPGANGFFPLAAEEVAVTLEAARNGAAYPRLVHRFRPPSVEAERAYRRLLAESLLVRGTRTPRTLLPARLPALTRLYDQLILGVEGYSIEGQPPVSRLQLLEHMDAWHKRVAVQALFGDLSADLSSEARRAPEDVPATAVTPAESPQ